MNSETKINTLCETCAAAAVRNSVTLCESCAKIFRVIFLPSDIRMWSEITRDGYTDEGVEQEELYNGMLVRIFNQQRELAKLNKRLEEFASFARRFRYLRDCRYINYTDCTKAIVAGGEMLDDFCDDGYRKWHGVTS